MTTVRVPPNPNADITNSLAWDVVTGTLSRELMLTLCGAFLGAGLTRDVFECRVDPALVVKVERSNGVFQNVMEWKIWQQIDCDPERARWVAPCRMLSPNGMVLLQLRTTPVGLADLPEKIPLWLSDSKRTNWGRLGDRVVAHDFGVSDILAIGATKRLVAPKWLDY